jgi:hypothetical protein
VASTLTRFTLTFRAPSVATGINSESNDNVWISTRNGQLVVNGADNGATLEVFNALGQKLISKIQKGSTIEYKNNLPAGTYVVKVIKEGKSLIKKIVID